jgi:hypothetical protein
VALELALEHPKLVRGLVLLEPPLHAKRRPTFGLVKAIMTAQVLGRARSSRAGAEAFLRWALSRSTGGDDLNRAPIAWREAIVRNSAAIVRELTAGTGEHIAAARLKGLHAPTRWLVGDRSDHAFASAARRAADSAPGISVTPERYGCSGSAPAGLKYIHSTWASSVRRAVAVVGPPRARWQRPSDQRDRRRPRPRRRLDLARSVRRSARQPFVAPREPSPQ